MTTSSASLRSAPGRYAALTPGAHTVHWRDRATAPSLLQTARGVLHAPAWSATPIGWDPTSHRFFSRRLKLHYVNRGNAKRPPLLFLHESRGDRRTWDRTHSWRHLVVALLTVACQSAPGATRTELAAYLERSRSWAPVEAETAKTIERILRTEFVDEAEVHRQIADSRPRLLAHLARVRAYSPHVDALRRLHERYVTAWQDLLAGYDAIDDGFASGDYTKLARGREAMGGWRDALVRVAADLRGLQQRFTRDAGGATES